jgi:hypothetical protein
MFFLTKSDIKKILCTYFITIIFFSDSLWLGTRNKFNEQLNDTKVRFTYFVPRDKAWKNLETEFPSTYKKLFMNEFSYHVSIRIINVPFIFNSSL